MNRIAPVWVLILLISACGGSTASPSPEAGSPKLTESQPASTPPGTAAEAEVFASNTLLADIAQNVAGDRLEIVSLLPIGSDPHSYQPTPKDVTRIAESKLLIINGAEYEHFLEALLENTEGKKEVIEASAGLSLREEAESEHGVDPHLWLDPNNVIVYVENIREGLTHFNPDGAAEFQSNADAYVAELHALDTWINEQVSHIPAEKRLLVTNHEALGYFAERYGFTVVGTVIESFSSDASPSAQQMAVLIDQIKASGAPAIFLDASDNPVLAEQIAAETGVMVVTDLHLESLTDGAPAATYLDLMKHNVTQIVDALK